MVTATNVKEAMSFFMSNSSGSLTCKKGDDTLEVESYPEAVEFFNAE